MVSRYRKQILAALLAAVWCPLAGFAESVQYGRAALPVESLETLEGGAVVIFSVGGEARIAAAPDLGRAIAAHYLSLAAHSGSAFFLPAATLLDVMRHALEAGDREVAQSALAAARAGWLKDGGAAETEAKLCVELLSSEDGALFTAERAQCSKSVAAQAQLLAQRGLFAEAFALASLGASRGSEAGIESEPLRAAQAALLAAEVGDLAAFLKHWEGAGDAFRRELLRAALREALSRSHMELVLELLARSDFSSRTTLEHEAARWLLESKPREAFVEESRERVCATLALFAQKDDAVKELLGERCSAAPGQSFNALAALIALPLSCGVLVAWRVRRLRRRQGETAAAGEVNDADSEWVKHLAFFHLSPSASLREIKAAYRRAIKALHPDQRGGERQGAASDEFIEATQRYEQLLRMHTERGAGGSARTN